MWVASGPALSRSPVTHANLSTTAHARLEKAAICYPRRSE
jgi:hypothetical protein